jgi:methylthioribose-1-phosphate isomerase
MIVRGAPAIGIAAAFGMAVGGRELKVESLKLKVSDAPLIKKFIQFGDYLKSSRPTAVNLAWAVDRMITRISNHEPRTTNHELRTILWAEAVAILNEDIAMNKAMGENGATLIKKGMTILTHCNAGALATGGHGTALGVIRTAHAQGKNIRVFADETRPRLQGARLTVFELQQDKIPVTLITDNMAGYLMKQGKIDCVIVGADRITRNGDVANKIGTYSVAVLANHHHIPFYVAAPYSTIDPTLKSGDSIPIEERDKDEVLRVGKTAIARPQTQVYNPAFDVTPSKLVTAIITESGVYRAPYRFTRA